MSELTRYDVAAGDLRARLESEEVHTARAEGWLFEDPQRMRPRYVDGRLLAARDLKQDQDYFLARQRDLLQAGTLGVIEGLRVERGARLSQLIINYGHGITEAGAMLWVGENTTVDFADVAQIQRLDDVFDLEQKPNDAARNRSGLFVLALRAVEYSANPVASYPESIQGPRSLSDGDIIEAAAVTLIPLENTAATDIEAGGQARLAREMFVRDGLRRLDAHALPLAVVALNRGEVSWFDEHMVRREAGVPDGIGFQRSEREAFIRQYTEQLRSVLKARLGQTGLRPLAANEQFRALPPFGPFPVSALQVTDEAIEQSFFPALMPVEVTLVPEDELPALAEDALGLAPIDLDASAEELKEAPVLVIIPIKRAVYASTIAALEGELTETPRPRVARVVPRDRPIAALQRFRRVLVDAKQSVSASARLKPWSVELEKALAREQASLETGATGEHDGLFFVRLRRGEDVTFAASRFTAFPPDSPEPSETFASVPRGRLVAAGELDALVSPVDNNVVHTTHRIDFVLRHTTNAVAQAVEALFCQPGFASDVVVNGAVAELSYLTRLRLEELIRSDTVRASQVDLDLEGVLAPAGSLPVRVRKLTLEHVAVTATRYADPKLGEGFAALVAKEGHLADPDVRRVIAETLRVPELDATARALDDAARTPFAAKLLELARKGDLIGMRDLTDIRVGPTPGAPDEVVWEEIPGFPGSATAVRINEGALYHLVHKAADAQTKTDISALLESPPDFAQPVVVTSFLADAVVEAYDIRFTDKASVDHVLEALHAFTLGGSFDPEEAQLPVPTLPSSSNEVALLLSKYTSMKDALLVPLHKRMGDLFTPPPPVDDALKFLPDDLRTLGLAGNRSAGNTLVAVFKLMRQIDAATEPTKTTLQTKLTNYITSIRTAAKARDLTTLRTLSSGPKP